MLWIISFIFQVQNKTVKLINDTLTYIINQADVFEHYQVDTCLFALGLSVNSHYRGRGIGTEILRARRALGTAVGIKLTTNPFTGAGVQSCGRKAGFEENVRFSYEELGSLGFEFPNIKEKVITVMSLPIP